MDSQKRTIEDQIDEPKYTFSKFGLERTSVI